MSRRLATSLSPQVQTGQLPGPSAIELHLCFRVGVLLFLLRRTAHPRQVPARPSASQGDSEGWGTGRERTLLPEEPTQQALLAQPHTGWTGSRVFREEGKPACLFYLAPHWATHVLNLGGRGGRGRCLLCPAALTLRVLPGGGEKPPGLHRRGVTPATRNVWPAGPTANASPGSGGASEHPRRLG